MIVPFHLINQVLVLPKAFWMPFQRNKGDHNSIRVFVLLVTSFHKDIHAVSIHWLKKTWPLLKLLWKTKTSGQFKVAVKSKSQLDQKRAA